MAVVSLPNRYFAGELTTQEALVATVPSATTDVVTCITFDNLTDVAQKATVKLADVLFAKDLDIAPRSLVVLDFKQTLNAADTIKVQASANSAVTCFISGVRITNS
jgi:hypothetical protein